MLHRLPPRLTPPKIGDLVRLSGPGGLGRAFKRQHGVGLVVNIVKPENRRIRYQVKWLKTDVKPAKTFKHDTDQFDIKLITNHLQLYFLTYNSRKSIA